MKKLYIGCRVKVIGKWDGVGAHEPACKTGFIWAKGIESLCGHMCDWGVELDTGELICGDTEDFEPILPNGHTPVSEEFLLTILPELEQFIGVSV
jgi:hypothetical protein